MTEKKRKSKVKLTCKIETKSTTFSIRSKMRIWLKRDSQIRKFSKLSVNNKMLSTSFH